MPTALIIVPTYNEVDNIAALLEGILTNTSDADVLVVDDNSPDGTAGVVRTKQLNSPRVHLMVRDQKNGLAAAYIAGFDWGITHGYEHLVQMDADFSHRPQDLPKLLAGLKDADVSIGCRYIEGGSTPGWSKSRQFISKGGNWYARLVLGVTCHDLTGGFNAWRREVLQEISLPTLKSRGYAFQVEMKYRAIRKGFRIHEIPICFEDRREGQSKMSGNIVWEAAFRVLQIRGYSA